MRLKDVMTREPECISPDDTIAHAAERMRDLDVGALPVCENNRLAGMITDRDITIRGTANCCDPKTAKVGDVMTPTISYCLEDQDVSDAALLMEERQIRRLPILNRDKKLVGIVSLGDLSIRTHDASLCAEALERISEPIPA